MTIQELIDTLQQQSGLYQELLELAVAKTPVLVKGDVDALSALLMKERKLAKRLEELEVRRQMLVNIHFSRLQLRLRSGKLSDLIRTVNQPEEKQLLTELQEGLSQMLDGLRQHNDHNQQLTAQSLQFVNYSIDLLTEDSGEDYIYKNPMTPQGDAKRVRMFDTKG
ncbi:FlgN protein [Paenibacillaceae bacterium GAS479]|nr:FlgN protein [Paenibacillaceae bacterium GAS479]